MGLLPEILRRTSVREFVQKPVERAKLDRILEAGRLAPSAKNRQPWRFVVVQDEEARARLRDAAFTEQVVATAPVIIALCTTNIEYKMPNGQLSYPMDISMAASFMVLQAVHEGLGTCIVTTFDEADVKSILSVPYSMRVVALVVLGHPEATHEKPDRLSTDRIVSHNHW